MNEQAKPVEDKSQSEGKNQKSKKSKKSRDLLPEHLPDFPWGTDKDNVESLGKVFQYVTDKIKETCKWYSKKKPLKKRGARWLRLSAIFFVAFAGVLPMLAELWKSNGNAVIPPLWASVFVAAAALMYALDHFLGHSSAWMRYLKTQFLLSSLLDEFAMKWAKEKAEWSDGKPSAEQVGKMLEKAAKFVDEANDIVLKETTVWITEFKRTLQELERAAKKNTTTQGRPGEGEQE